MQVRPQFDLTQARQLLAGTTTENVAAVLGQVSAQVNAQVDAYQEGPFLACMEKGAPDEAELARIRAEYPERGRRAQEAVGPLAEQMQGLLPLYRQHLDEHRATSEHPDNVRWAAANSQNHGTPVPFSPDSLSPQAERFVRALRESESLDDAIARFEQTITLPALDRDRPDGKVFPLAPVSTRRSDPHSWRKADNDNPNVKRLAILIEDGTPPTRRDSDELERRFSTDYRTDEIIRVGPPTADEMLRGVTMPDKVRAAYARARSFAAEHPGQRLEAFTSYQGHGMAVPTGNPYQEGSLEWLGLVAGGDRQNLTESFLKQLERDFLGQYGYVVGYNGSCQSGALIA